MVMCWLVGIVGIALLLGSVTGPLLWCLRRWQGLHPKLDDDPETKPVPPWLMGWIERSAFSLLIWWLGLTDATLTGMFAWLALKLATNWTRPRDDIDPKRQAKLIRLSQGALLAGVISLMLAAWGGLVARGEWLPCANGLLSLCIPSTVAPSDYLGADQS
jgi:hypothetical protein